MRIILNDVDSKNDFEADTFIMDRKAVKTGSLDSDFRITVRSVESHPYSSNLDRKRFRPSGVDTVTDLDSVLINTEAALHIL